MRRKDGLIAMDLRYLHEELFACMPYSNKNRELYFIAFHTDDIDSTLDLVVHVLFLESPL